MLLIKYLTAHSGDMKILYHPAVLGHETGDHPESMARMSHFTDLEELHEVPDGEPYMSLVHPQSYIDLIKHHAETGKPLDGDTQASVLSFRAAAAAVGITMMAMEQGDFALIRPPGHHAFADEAHGFCLFNNIAIAAQKAVNEGKKVLILDFDGHLGDGTMDIFYESDQVLFWSLHQYPAYPGNGYANEIGEGKGKYYTMNVPLRRAAATILCGTPLSTCGRWWSSSTPIWWPFRRDLTRTSLTPCCNSMLPPIFITK